MTDLMPELAGRYVIVFCHLRREHGGRLPECAGATDQISFDLLKLRAGNDLIHRQPCQPLVATAIEHIMMLREFVFQQFNKGRLVMR